MNTQTDRHKCNEMPSPPCETCWRKQRCAVDAHVCSDFKIYQDAQKYSRKLRAKNLSKYTREQRKRVHDMYWQGREPRRSGRKLRGDYTLDQIAELTGVHRSMIFAIARGER